MWDTGALKTLSALDYLFCQARVFGKLYLRDSLYLADWRSAIERDRPITAVLWTAHARGPSPTMDETSQRILDGYYARASYRRRARVLAWLGKVCHCPFALSDDDRKILDFVATGAMKKAPIAFVQLVNSTYPLVGLNDGELDLPALAVEYRSVRHRFVPAEPTADPGALCESEPSGS